MQNLLRELKNRGTVRVAAAYLVIAWLFAQVAELVLDSFEADPWIMQTILVLIGIGLPIAILVSWFFELTPQGLVREADVDRSEVMHKARGRRIDLIIIAILIVIVAYFVVDRIRPSMDTAIDRSIAVLPFVNRSPEPDSQYFSDGVHDDLLTQLARLGDLKVISRTSVMEYRDTTKNMRQIGRELGVATLMEGSVQRIGRRVRVTAQLINAQTDAHIWAGTFDRDLSPDNLLDIQTEIAEAIAGELSANLSLVATSAALDQSATSHQDAWDLYQRARAIPIDGAEENLWAGIRLMEQALEIDPGFALAMGQMASNYLNIYWFSSQDPAHREAARDWIERALALSPEDPRLYLIQGELLYTGYLDYAAALAALDKAQAGMPGVASVYFNRAAVLRRSGDFEAARLAFEKAQLLDPRDAAIFAHHIFTFTYTGDVEAALAQSERVRSLPSATSVHRGFTYLPELFMLGDTRPMAAYLASNPDVDLGPEQELKVLIPILERDDDKALSVMEQMPDPISVQNHLWTHSSVRARIHLAQGQPDAARSEAAKAIPELEAIAATMPDNPRPLVTLALMHAILGERDATLANIRRVETVYPRSLDLMDAPLYQAGGLLALAVLEDSEPLAVAMEDYLSLPIKPFYVDYLLLDPVFDRHRDHPAIAALVERYSLKRAVRQPGD